MNHRTNRSLSRNIHACFTAASLAASLLFAGSAVAQTAPAAAPPAVEAPPAATPAPAKSDAYRWGAHAELDVGALLALKQGAAFAGGVVYGPFRAGMSYATFLSNKSFGGAPDGFSLRANYIVGFNASYFIAQRTDEGLYVQAQFHIKQQGVTNLDNGAHKDLDSLAAGLELGYVWKVYKGLYVAPRVGALYYIKKPQGSGNRPVSIGGRDYDNSRHKNFDTYYIPTLSVGYSW
ncbi:MAG TPA: hypothetical protein VHP33_40050 [Polyangiaceae bacterium]|nr:hypothetical protein [Polyangiaceae bacterium]